MLLNPTRVGKRYEFRLFTTQVHLFDTQFMWILLWFFLFVLTWPFCASESGFNTFF